MPELLSLLDMFQSGGLLGILVILAFPTLRAKFGFSNEKVDVDVLADALNKALVENDHSPILVKSRLGRICEDISALKEDVSIIKQVITK